MIARAWFLILLLALLPSRPAWAADACLDLFRPDYVKAFADPHGIGVDEGRYRRDLSDDRYDWFELGEGYNAAVFRLVSRANPAKTRVMKIYSGWSSMQHEYLSLRMARRATIGLRGLRAIKILDQGVLPKEGRLGRFSRRPFLVLEDVRGRSLAKRPLSVPDSFWSRLSELKLKFRRNLKWIHPFSVDESNLEYGNIKLQVPVIWGVPLLHAQVSLNHDNLVVEASTGQVVIVDPQ